MKLKKFNSINVIPFIDVLLVLLAIVLMASTFIAKGIIPISLAEAKDSNTLKVHKSINISIKKDNSLYMEKLHYSIEALAVSFKSIDNKTPILINSDKESRFEIFVQVLNILKLYEFNNISIVTKK